MDCPKCGGKWARTEIKCSFCEGGGYVPDGSFYYRKETESNGFIELSRYSTGEKAKLVVYRGGIGAYRTDLTTSEIQALLLILVDVL